MTGRTPFKDLMKDWPADRQARHEAHKAALASEYETLEKLRAALGVSQGELAARLEVHQPAISKIVNNPNLKIETMRDVVEALGGVLIVSAVFGDTQVVLQTMDKPKKKTPKRAVVGGGKTLKRGPIQAGDFTYPVVSRARQGTVVRESSSGQFVTKDKSKRVKAKHPNLKKT